jgi:hypothetical protein
MTAQTKIHTELNSRSCLSGTALPGYLQLQAVRPVHPLRQEQDRKYTQEWREMKVVIRPGNVIAGGASGMGPSPPQQHQPPGGA